MKQHTAYAVVYKRNSPRNDGEMVKGSIHSIHTFRSTAKLVSDPYWHVIKKITFTL
jgi:hypothetical protein